MQEDRLAQEIADAQEATELLNNRAFNNTMDKLQKQLIDDVFTTDDVQKRDLAITKWRAYEDIRQSLRVAVRNGTIARGRLDDKVSGAEQKQFGRV